MKMSLAQALRKKNEIVNEVATLQSRIREAVVYREGSEIYSSAEFIAMQSALKQCCKNLVTVKVAIDRGNHTSFDGSTVYQLITQRGETKQALEFLVALRNTVAGGMNGGYGYREEERAPKAMTRMPIKDIAIDASKKAMREMDDKISNINGKLDIEVEI
jgi:hypothetical protein